MLQVYVVLSEPEQRKAKLELAKDKLVLTWMNIKYMVVRQIHNHPVGGIALHSLKEP